MARWLDHHINTQRKNIIGRILEDRVFLVERLYTFVLKLCEKRIQQMLHKDLAT